MIATLYIHVHVPILKQCVPTYVHRLQWKENSILLWLLMSPIVFMYKSSSVTIVAIVLRFT